MCRKKCLYLQYNHHLLRGGTLLTKIMTNQIAYYCKKRFIDQHDIIREKGNKTLDFKRMQGE